MASITSVSEHPEFDGLSALSLTVDYLDIHLLIAGGVTAAFTIVACAHVELRKSRPELSFTSYIIPTFMFLLLFAIFGAVTSFFFSLGLKRAESGNDVVQLFASPFIALLTAAVAFMASKRSITRDRA